GGIDQLGRLSPGAGRLGATRGGSMDPRLIPIAALTTATLATAWLGGTAVAADATATLRLLETSDLHDHVTDYDYYRDRGDVTVGLARTAALIRQAREAV